MTRAKAGDMVRQTETYDTLHVGTNDTAGVSPLSALPTRIWQVQIQALSTNGASVFWGNQNAQPMELVAGASQTIPIDRLTKVYVNITAGDEVRWAAMG